MDHPNVIKYYHSFIEHGALYIIMEYAEGGDLHQLMREKRATESRFKEQELWKYSYEISLGVAYLHENHVLHRDIKSLNIFLTKDKQIKIGDFGVSRILSGREVLISTKVGTPLYLSPEQVKQQPYDFKIDIWGIGCCLYHLAQLEPPFKADNLISLGHLII